jgi:hemophore-related protein
MTMSRRLQGRSVTRRVFGAAVAGMASGVVALAAAGVAGGQPSSDPCSPAEVLRTKADTMIKMANFLDGHPDVQQAFKDAWSNSTPQERQNAIKAAWTAARTWLPRARTFTNPKKI